MRDGLRFLCLPLIAVMTLPAADATWKSKAIAQWTVEEAKQVLADSPWAKRTAVSVLPLRSEDQLRDGGRMGGGARRAGVGWQDGKSAPADGGDQHPAVEIRWESALPVRASEMKAGETGAPDWEGDYYAIAVYDVPGVTPALEKSLRGELKQTTFLKRTGKKDLKPARVEIDQLGHNMARIVYLFARTTELTVADARVEFVSQVGRIFVAQFFETGEMQFQGKLEL